MSLTVKRGSAALDAKGIYCVLEAPDEVAIRNHHNGNCNEVIGVESLL